MLGGLPCKTFAICAYIVHTADFYCVFVGKSGPSVYTKPSGMSRAVLKAASRSLPLCPPTLADLRMAGVCLSADKFWCDNSFYGCGDRFWFAVAHCRLLGMRLCLAAMSLVFRKSSGPCDHDGAMLAVTFFCAGLSGNECAAIVVCFHLWLRISKREKREPL